MADLVKFWRSGPTIFANSGVTIGEKGRYMGGKRGVMVGEKVEGYGW